MGLAASQARLLMLTARKSDIEFKVQIINQRRTVLAYQSAQLSRSYANAIYQSDNVNSNPANDAGVVTPAYGTGNNDVIDVLFPGSSYPDNQPVDVSDEESAVGSTSLYEAQMATVQAMDKELELRAKDLDTQHKCVETEVDAVKKVIDKNIESSFKTFG
jgi:hypothetical protein